jgi:hypothetical protein
LKLCDADIKGKLKKLIARAGSDEPKNTEPAQVKLGEAGR